MNIEIEKLTTWSAGREVRTQNGPRILRKGPLTAEYRAAWRANKEEMKKVGLSMGPVDRNNPQGDWEAVWWQPINGEVAKERDAAVEASRATDAAVEISAPDGLAYMPFQKAGIAFAMGKPGVLLADEMGLGKTIQAIGIINADPSIKRVIVVCPASLKVNWRNELNKWLVRPARVAIQNAGQPWAGSVADIIVINYDILGKFTRQLMAETWDLLVADECTYAKNPQAQRTKLLVGAQRKADREKYPGIRAVRKVAATGTPILNKPVELFPILDYIAPGQWGFKDKIRYCKGYKGRWGWDFTGHAHEEEFQRRLRSTCFVGTTIVESERGPIQIRDIARQLPVRVWSADSMGRVSLKSVVGVRAKENRQILIEIRFAGGKIRCTPDHRVFTQRGYIRADRITGADSLFFLRKEGYQDSNRNPCTIEAGHRARLLNDVRRETQTETPQGSIPEKFRFASKSHSESVPTVQVGIHGQECASVSGPDILHSFMPWEKHSEQTKFSRGDSKKSHVESEADYAETTATAWIDGETTPALRVIDSREFAEAPRPGASAIVRRACDSRGTNGRSHDSQWQSGIRGHSVAGKDVGCRSGRSDSCGKKTANQGQREGQITEWIGVLSAESVAMGNRGGASGCGSEDNVVYDIEVADNHNFFANGVLVHNCMLRRLKKDVLTELPAKRRQIIELDAGDAASLCAEEVDLYDGNSEEIEAASADKALAEAADDEEAYKNAVARLRSAQKVAFERISKVRHEVALAKVEQAVDHVMDVLESTPKLVVFAHHLDVIARIERELTERLQAEGSASNPVCVITGQTPVGERQGIVDLFNGDPGKRVLILGIHAAGVGLSVKAAVEVFVELDWVPGIISQAEDRCHGIGRGIEGEPLLVQHLVLEGSLDSRMAKIVVAKQDVADRMLDKDTAKLATGEPVTALDIEFDADKIRREDAKAEDPELHDVVLRGLQMLAGVCDGAAMRDDMGFNGCDARIGHSLARLSRLSPKQVALGRRLLIKYRRQLPDDVNAKIRGKE